MSGDPYLQTFTNMTS